MNGVIAEECGLSVGEAIEVWAWLVKRGKAPPYVDAE